MHIDIGINRITGGLRFYLNQRSWEFIIQPLLPCWEPLLNVNFSRGGMSKSFPCWKSNEYMVWSMYKLPLVPILYIKRWKLNNGI